MQDILIVLWLPLYPCINNRLQCPINGNYRHLDFIANISTLSILSVSLNKLRLFSFSI